MAEFRYQEMFPHGVDTTPYRKLDGAWDTFRGERVLTIDAGALTRLAFEAVRDISHLFRPGHLAQLRKIIDDPEASMNDRFVALNMLRNACVSAGMVLPSCQDTGTAIVIGKKGQRVWTSAVANGSTRVNGSVKPTPRDSAYVRADDAASARSSAPQRRRWRGTGLGSGWQTSSDSSVEECRRTDLTNERWPTRAQTDLGALKRQ